jgi:phosphoribosylamine--glycine ligase
LILDDVVEAKSELKAMVQDQKFGAASKKVVIEEFLKGIELSVFVITDGDSYLILPEAKDYKRINDGDNGPNTGGMGTVSPVPFADDVFKERVEKEIIIPTIRGLKNEGRLYQGFIFFGLMKVGNDPYVIEYNVRLGDPEAESVLVRIDNDLVALFNAVVDGSLDGQEILISEKHAVTVMLVSGGYPGSYRKGMPITFPDNTGSIVFHAGTRNDGTSIATNGGRVLGVTSLGESLKEAITLAYQTASMVSFDGIYYRKDIGFDLLTINKNSK